MRGTMWILIEFSIPETWDTPYRSLLKRYATSQEVVGSIPNVIIEFIQST
jgi:hypothetical protein